MLTVKITDINTSANYPKAFQPIKMNIIHENTVVGEAEVILCHHSDEATGNKSLIDIAKTFREDLYLSLCALSKHWYLESDCLNKAPIIAHLAYLFIFPEYRNNGYASEFIDELPNLVQRITFSRPLCMITYIEPRSKYHDAAGNLVELSELERTQMRTQMDKLFEKHMYFRPSCRHDHQRAFMAFA